MADSKHTPFFQAFECFFSKISSQSFRWVLTGSFRLSLEDKNLFKDNDIDILTDKEGINQIKKIFKQNILTDFSFVESEKIKSNFGQLSINGVTLEVMSDVQNYVNGEWIKIPKLDDIIYLTFKNWQIPVLPLSIELNVCQKLKQQEKANHIIQLINKKQMDKDLSTTKLYERLKELRVSFAYSKNAFFEASKRFAKKEEKQAKIVRVLEITSIVISVATLSSLAVYFSNNFETMSLMIIGVLSIIEIGISVYLLTVKQGNLSEEYSRLANDYLFLYKEAKTTEAKVEDKAISMPILSEKIDELTSKQSKLANPKLIPSSEDYEKAKKGIDSGANAFTKSDFKNT